MLSVASPPPRSLPAARIAGVAARVGSEIVSKDVALMKCDLGMVVALGSFALTAGLLALGGLTPGPLPEPPEAGPFTKGWEYGTVPPETE